MKIQALLIIFIISSSNIACSAMPREVVISKAANGDYKSLYVLQQYAERGCPIAQGAIGFMYYIGKGVKKDYYEAFKWTKLSAKQGKKEALGLLGEMYYYGRGTEKNYRKSFLFFKQAAEKGDNIAQKWLGKMYYKGEGTKKDLVQAYKWFKLSKLVNKDFFEKNGIESNMSPLQIAQGKRLAMTWRRRH